MKKLFTLLTLALISIGSAWGQATTIFDASDWSGKEVSGGSVTVGNVTYYNTANPDITTSSKTFSGNVTWTAYLKTGGGSTLTAESKVRVLTYTPTTAGTIKVYARGGGKSLRYVYITQTASTDNSEQLGSGQGGDGSSQSDCIAEAEVEGGQTVYIWCSGSMLIYGITFESSVPTTKTTANSAADGQIAYLDNSGAISGNDTEPYVAYTMSYSSYPMTITCSTADKGEIQSGSDNYQFTIGGSNYTGAKYSKKTYYIIPDEGATITAVSAYASSNSDKTITIGTYGGTTQDLSARGTLGTPATPSAFPLAKNASGYYEFSLSGAAAQALVVLKVTYSTIESIDVKVSSAGYATLFYDKDLTIPAGVEAYYGKMNGAGDAFEMTQITSGKIPANTGVILKAAAGTYKFLTTSGAEAIAAADNDLTGVTTATAVAANSVYTLGQNGEGVVGMRVYSGTSIRAYSAYITGASPAREFVELDIDGYATGIKKIDDVRSKKDDVYYDLQGRRVLYPTKGLYIVNGKKVIVK